MKNKQDLLLKYWLLICTVFQWFWTGAIKLHTPLLMPKNRKLYEHSETSYLIDHSGMLVMLPYDLRVSTCDHRNVIQQSCIIANLTEPAAYS